jgi:hypothetical protein
VLLRHHVGTAGPGHEHRLVEIVGGGVADVRPGRDLLPQLEVDRSAGVARADDGAPGADEVAAVERRQELDLLVAGEQALVAVGVDGELGHDVAEQLQTVRTVDQVPAVVHIRRGQPRPQLNRQTLHD